MILGLSGFAGAGKSTIAEYLVRQHGFVRLSFASAVKDVTASAFGWDRQRLEGSSPQDRDWREQPDPFWSQRMGKPFSPRTALQYIGTDIFRNRVLSTIWVDNVIVKIRNTAPTANIVIDDVRFVNERQSLAAEGARFLLVRRTEFQTPLHTELWRAARGRFDVRDIALDSPHSLHPSEWDWLRDATVASDPVLVNSGSYDELYAAVDAWYTPLASDALLLTQ